MGAMSIRKPTPIQQGCIPAILAGRDCIGIAQTGSGKTLAFALPILQRIARDPYGVWAVVLTPTRELAFQLAEQFHILGVPLNITTSVVVGGMDIITQAQAMCARPHVVVATPGRLVDLLRSSGGEWGLDRVQTLVLDEADRMLTPTFAPDLAYLFSRMPVDRQTCLFTATESDAIRTLEEKEPRAGKDKIFVHKVLMDTTTVSTLKQHYLFIPSHIREPYLYYLLLNPPKSILHLRRPNPNLPKPSASTSSASSRKRDRSGPGSKASKPTTAPEDEAPPWPPSTIIFTSRCATTAHIHSLLTELLIPSVALHSYLSQKERLASLAAFRSGQVPVLVATDVGSRGLDIPEVAMVVNWDCPREAEDYVHRVGRTARAGRGGVAVTMVTERDTELVGGIEKVIKATLTELVLPEAAVLEDLNKVSTAKRVAAMSLHDAGFGEKQKARAVLEGKRRKRDAARNA
ncbi:DEAD-domain-containing protein [Mrakia frigida]|uniref:DEAD/DEAH box helicase n=1 Tax=Mrakia frigida TaxID=29902 RepID=UPI003FCC261F